MSGKYPDHIHTSEGIVTVERFEALTERLRADLKLYDDHLVKANARIDAALAVIMGTRADDDLVSVLGQIVKALKGEPSDAE